jgi:signal transduction histidine kinase
MSRRRRPPGLKQILGGLAGGALALPIALALVVSAILTSSLPRAPFLRLEYLRHELAQSIEIGDSQALVVKGGYKAPPGFGIVVEDGYGRILLSSDSRFVQGGFALLADVAAAVRADGESGSFFAETLRAAGRPIGRYYAWFTSDFVPSGPRASPVAILVVVGLGALAFGAGLVVATNLARAVLKLERAAGRIAAGDLASEVRVRGIREIEELSAAMDGMRAALARDRDRRSRFLAAVSHDLRTPLTSIGGYLEAVSDGLAADPATLERYVKIMRAKTNLLENRITALIEYARMESGDRRMRFEPLELRPFLEEFCREAREDAALMGREFEYELSALGSLAAPVDRTFLSRALENVVSNAIRYTPQGGVISMTVARIADEAGRAEDPGRGMAIDIDDEGPGIPEAERERVFDPFVRGGSAREGEGTGLGLYIARSVVKGHGWRIAAQGSPRGGCRIRITLPGA